MLHPDLVNHRLDSPSTRPPRYNFGEKMSGCIFVPRYFGEKIGLYFLFSRHITYSLRVPIVFGICVTMFQIVVEATASDGSWWKEFAGEGMLILNAIFLSVWASHAIESWEVKEEKKLIQLQGRGGRRSGGLGEGLRWVRGGGFGVGRWWSLRGFQFLERNFKK